MRVGTKITAIRAFYRSSVPDLLTAPAAGTILKNRKTTRSEWKMLLDVTLRITPEMAKDAQGK